MLAFAPVLGERKPVDASPPIDTIRRKTLLNRVVASTLAVQVAIVMASLTVPVLASAIAPAVGVPSYWVGYYSALIYGCATLSSFATPLLFRRWGGIRLHQGMLVMVAVALMALLPAWPAGFAASGIVLGLAYGPMNPASAVLLMRYTPSHLRSRVFSFKQTAVPDRAAHSRRPGDAARRGARSAGAARWPRHRGACAYALERADPAVGATAIDEDRASSARPRGVSVKFWLPLRLIAENGELRSVTVAAFAFGSLQFSFVAVFPTVLAHVGWSTTDAGRAMSVALVVGVVLRVPWGTLADKIGSRPILAAMGVMMSLASGAACFLGAGWSGTGRDAARRDCSACRRSAGRGSGSPKRCATSRRALCARGGAPGSSASRMFFGALVGPSLFSSIAALGRHRGAGAFAILAAAWPRSARRCCCAGAAASRSPHPSSGWARDFQTAVIARSAATKQSQAALALRRGPLRREIAAPPHGGSQ